MCMHVWLHVRACLVMRVLACVCACVVACEYAHVFVVAVMCQSHEVQEHACACVQVCVCACLWVCMNLNRCLCKFV